MEEILQTLINKFINLFKWPIAVYMIVLLPAIFKSIDYFKFTNMKFVYFGAGIVAYIFIRAASDSGTRTSLQTLIHELTHSFFALLTFHKIKKISLNQDNGGEMAFEGEGNWLIIIAPYFFPLMILFYIAITSIWSAFLPTNFIFPIILGYLFGMHLDTVVSQIHEKQTDLPKVSYLFCAMFLPGANLITWGFILAYNSIGIGGISTYFRLINRLTSQFYSAMWQSLF